MAASPATIPAIVKQVTVENVGRLPGVLYSTSGASPVVLSKASEIAYLAFWYTEKFVTRTNVTLTMGGKAPVCSICEESI